MKTTKLFFALAIAAGLAACTKEVLVEPEKAIDSFDEIKGAKVLANGFSVELDPEAETKVAVEGGVPKFVENDKAGIAWFVKNGIVDGVQSGAAQSDLYATAYANHKLTHDGSRFNSNSNVFEGWHVAYFPYKEMTRPGYLEFTVNPEMKVKPTTDDEYAKEQYENSVMFSAAHFVGVDDVDDGLIKTPMKLQFVANAIRPKFTLDPNFKAVEIKNQKIVSVTLSAGTKALFADSLTVNPSKFPAEDDTFNKTHFGPNDQALVRPHAALQARPGYVTSVTTTVAEDEDLQNQYTVGSENLNFRMFLAPVPAAVAETVKASDLTITVALENGNSFVLSGKSPSTDKNAEKFGRLAGYLNGTLTNSEGLSLQDIILDEYGRLQPITFPFDLTAADYQYTPRAESIEQWCEQVALAKAMGATELEIGLPKNSTIEFPEGDMYTEGLAITVKAATGGAKLVFAEETNWSDNITLSKNVSVEVEETGVLTVGENGLTSKANITNAGTIVLLDGADLTAKAITNEGTIEVSVGSEITPLPTGDVVYTVDETVATAVIDDLIADANLNTLVVNANLESATALSWPSLTVEMNGAVLTADVTAAAINVNEGENAINGNITATAVTVAEDATLTFNGNITGDVNVEAGATLTVTGDIDGDVTVDGTAILKHTNMPADKMLTVNGDVTIDTKDLLQARRLIFGNIDNNGTLTIEGGADVFVVDLDLENATTTTVEAGTLYYYGDIILGGDTSGSIKPAETPDPANGYEVIGDIYYVEAENGLANAIDNATEETINVVLEADVKLEAGTSMKSIKIDANGKKITFNKTTLAELAMTGTSVEISNATIETSGQTVGNYYEHALAFACPVKLTNVTTKTTILVSGDYDHEFNNVKFYDESDNYALWVYPNGQDIKITGCEFKCGRGINVEEINSTSEVKDTKLTVSGTKFTTQKKAAVKVHSAKKVEIVWSNNDISGVAADNVNAVWIDERVKEYDYAKATTYINNVVVTGATPPVVE